jgi:hypothetical protein
MGQAESSKARGGKYHDEHGGGKVDSARTATATAEAKSVGIWEVDLHRINSELLERIDLETYRRLFTKRFPTKDFEPFEKEFLQYCDTDLTISRDKLNVADRARTLDEHGYLDCHETICCGIRCCVLPCYNELDDGVPPCCRGNPPVAWWKVFNHYHRVTNDNAGCIALGNTGFHHFSHYRKFYMGGAMWSTFISIFFTVWGTSALSSDQDVVRLTKWAWLGARNHTSGEVFEIHVGLSSLLYVHDCVVGIGNSKNCEKTTLYMHKNNHGDGWPNLFIRDGIQECRDMAMISGFGIFVTCVTLGFALLGCMNRMKFRADSNIQKTLGMVTDLCGFISLGITLRDFRLTCYNAILEHGSFGGEMEVVAELGPGYTCLLVCIFAAALRALFHWLTPLPEERYAGRGSGCKPALPHHLKEVIDVQISKDWDSADDGGFPVSNDVEGSIDDSTGTDARPVSPSGPRSIGPQLRSLDKYKVRNRTYGKHSPLEWRARIEKLRHARFAHAALHGMRHTRARTAAGSVATLRQRPGVMSFDSVETATTAQPPPPPGTEKGAMGTGHEPQGQGPGTGSVIGLMSESTESESHGESKKSKKQEAAKAIA